ncbi:protein Brevis radix-like 2 [Phragmites australis]|uniref:protein Brevis radix-like 2 n=1 Tax=Phragmites australis TaxID=29695 RepID=UPI002D77A45A|nr:protein Brevis radix-like 2 [Phragmites australis]XP_062185417.1 protein Brevis radix-like 2 [Phragmites australis]
MLACIACSSKEGGEDGSSAAATPHGKDAVKSLTSQLKDMVLKFSGSNKQHKGAAGAPSSRSYRPRYPGFIDDTGFTLTSRVLGEDYHARTALAAANAGVRTAPPTWDVARSNRGWQQGVKSPGGSSWDPSIGEAAGDEVVVVEEAAVPREWTAQVEPGVQITFGTLPGGGNDLKRIRFSREMFNKWEAQRWWGENYDRIVELYNVLTFSGRQQGGSTPASSVDDSVLRELSYSRGGSTRGSPVVMPPQPPPASKEPIARSTSCKAMPGSSAPYAASPSTTAAYYPSAAVPDPSDHVWAHHFNMLTSAAAGTSAMGGGGPSSYDPSRATTSSRDEASVSISNASDLEAAEWIEEDEPGVCLTIRELGDGTRELRRIRFSRERFGEDRAKVWWEQNRERIQAEYL